MLFGEISFEVDLPDVRHSDRFVHGQWEKVLEDIYLVIGDSDCVIRVEDRAFGHVQDTFNLQYTSKLETKPSYNLGQKNLSE